MEEKIFLKTCNFFASYYIYCVAVYPAVNGLISFNVLKDHKEASVQFRRAAHHKQSSECLCISPKNLLSKNL